MTVDVTDPTSEFTELLARYSPEVRHLALGARGLVLEVFPEATEQVDFPSKLIAYSVGLKMSDVVCVITPLKSAVNLGFYRAVDLPDPHGLLEGTGKLHRHVKIKTAEELRSPALRQLLEAARAAKKLSTP